MTLQERIEGCMWGLMCGDAIGAPVEFKNPDELEERHPGGVKGIVHCWDDLRDLQLGQITDDSEMAICLLQSLVDEGRYDAAAVRRNYVDWMNSEPRDYGNTIGDALSCNHYDPDSEANGALMRIAPLAVFAALHPELDWRAAARADAALTHINPKCADANVVYVGAVLDALNGMPGEDIYARALEAAKGNPALHQLLRDAADTEPAVYPNIGWLHRAFPTAFYHILHAKDYPSAILRIVNLIGDPDTNAAIAGALLGAYMGVGAIPAEWRKTVLACKPASRPAKYHAAHAADLLKKLS